MAQFAKWAVVGLAGLFSAQSAQTQPVDVQPTAQQAKLLDLLERGAKHLLAKGEHVPVTAFVMRPSGEIDLIDLEQGFAHQEDALTATLGRLIPMARAKEIVASGIMFQPGDAGEEKPPVLIFDVEQVNHPRFFVTLTYSRQGNEVSFGPKTYNAAPAKLFAK
ncbi:hypothetical protein [Sphingomonas koreensis]|jgi:hypothetical protein|nr:hypothetical protein [Sphingomonas koreensis]MDC7812065.1 hypothetical protein [Sphingomonas koreensis]RSX98560.1 hypothetical protein DAH87_04495 [Sphingomonas koreensis]